jgi:hypothetical protein
LLNIKKKSAVSLNLLSNGKLSGCLEAVTLFFCSHVSELNKPRLLASHVHLRPVLKLTVEDEDAQGGGQNQNESCCFMEWRQRQLLRVLFSNPAGL